MDGSVVRTARLVTDAFTLQSFTIITHETIHSGNLPMKNRFWEKYIHHVIGKGFVTPGRRMVLTWEVCVAWEMAQPFFVRERGRGIEGETDVIAGRRWLREWIHTFDVSGDVSGGPDLEVGAGGPVWRPASDEKTSKQKTYPPNLLQPLGSMSWGAAFPDLIPVPRRKQGRNVGNFGLPEAELVFRPLLGTGEVASGEVVRTTGYPSIHHAGFTCKRQCER